MKIISSLFLILFLIGCSTTPQVKQPEKNIEVRIQSSLTEKQKTDLVMFSFALMDTKYKWGSKKPDFGLDCSGLVSYVFKKSINVTLTGAARDIVKNGSEIPISYAFNNLLEPGDLLFFNTTGQSFSHVGIYIGDNKFLHASSKQGKVIISSVLNSYYSKKLEVIKRL